MFINFLKSLRKTSTPKTFNIDWDFIRELEGYRLKGYVPKDTDKNNKVVSGVTIVSGFDLGQHSTEDLSKLKLPTHLELKLGLYTLLKGREAKDLLERYPLVLSEEEGRKVNEAVHTAAMLRIESEYNKYSKKPFKSLTRAQQTVIMSVGFQYGSLSKRTPNFWGIVTRQDWKAAIKALRNFGDGYKPRRLKEAVFLEKEMK